MKIVKDQYPIFYTSINTCLSFVLLLLITFLLSLSVNADSPSSIRISDLHCAYMDTPQGIDHQSPNFGWVLDSVERGQHQTAYQILVYDNNDNLVWDSGKVTSSESSHIKYAGTPLMSSAIYHWQVSVWDKNDQASEYTDKARFVTGVIEPEGWKAVWIGRGPVEEPSTEDGPDFEDLQSTLLRNEFVVEKPISSAVAHICGLGLYHLYINGEKTGNHRDMLPLKTLYSEQVLYSTYDITENINQGTNAIGIMLGNGWYNTAPRFRDWRMQWSGYPKAIMQLHVRYQDETEEVFISDASWKTTTGPITSSCLFDGEVYDARLEQPGWNTPGFNDADWDDVNLIQTPQGKLVSHLGPPITITESIQPKNVQEVDEGVFVFDMGQNFSGWSKIRAEGPEGTEILLRHAENINDDGTLNTGTLRKALNTNRFILSGNGSVEDYEPYFTNHGYRYVEVSGYPGTPTLEDVIGRVVHSDCAITGHFTTDNDLVNHIYHCAFWSQRSIMQGLPVDCPQRDERLGWGADGHVQAESSMYAFDVHQFYAKWLRDWQVQQSTETGELPHITPWHGLEDGYPCWSSAYPIIIWQMYLHYGDKQLLAEHFENLKLYINYLEGQSHYHIQPRDDSGDWMSTVVQVRGGPLLLSTAFYLFSTQILADIATTLDKTEEAQYYHQMVDDIAAAFNKVFMRDSARRGYPYGENSQLENAMSLYLGIVPDRARNRVAVNLIRDIENRGHLSGGFIGTKYVMDTLTKIDRADIGFYLLTLEEGISWGVMTKGRTTMPETWGGGGSHNHAGLGGSIIAWVFKSLAGINPDPKNPGFASVIIKPYIPEENLNFVDASMKTIKGTVASRWKREENILHFDVTIPVNVNATVYVPTTDPESVLESGRPISDSEDIKVIAIHDNALEVKLTSGMYQFHTKI